MLTGKVTPIVAMNGLQRRPTSQSGRRKAPDSFGTEQGPTARTRPSFEFFIGCRLELLSDDILFGHPVTFVCHSNAAPEVRRIVWWDDGYQDVRLALRPQCVAA